MLSFYVYVRIPAGCSSSCGAWGTQLELRGLSMHAGTRDAVGGRGGLRCPLPLPFPSVSTRLSNPKHCRWRTGSLSIHGCMYGGVYIYCRDTVYAFWYYRHAVLMQTDASGPGPPDRCACVQKMQQQTNRGRGLVNPPAAWHMLRALKSFPPSPRSGRPCEGGHACAMCIYIVLCHTYERVYAMQH